MSSITKRGSGHIRRILVEIAHVITRTKGRSRLESFFLRIKAKKAKKGTNSLLLPSQERCYAYCIISSQFRRCIKRRKKDRDAEVEDLGIQGQEISLDDMILHLAKAGYEVRKRALLAGG